MDAQAQSQPSVVAALGNAAGTRGGAAMRTLRGLAQSLKVDPDGLDKVALVQRIGAQLGVLVGAEGVVVDDPVIDDLDDPPPPPGWICPIARHLILDPVVTSDRQVYHGPALVAALAAQEPENPSIPVLRSPHTNTPLTAPYAFRVSLLRAEIAAWLLCHYGIQLPEPAASEIYLGPPGSLPGSQGPQGPPAVVDMILGDPNSDDDSSDDTYEPSHTVDYQAAYSNFVEPILRHESVPETTLAFAVFLLVHAYLESTDAEQPNLQLHIVPQVGYEAIEEATLTWPPRITAARLNWHDLSIFSLYQARWIVTQLTKARDTAMATRRACADNTSVATYVGPETAQTVPSTTWDRLASALQTENDAELQEALLELQSQISHMRSRRRVTAMVARYLLWRAAAVVTVNPARIIGRLVEWGADNFQECAFTAAATGNYSFVEVLTANYVIGTESQYPNYGHWFSWALVMAVISNPRVEATPYLLEALFAIWRTYGFEYELFIIIVLSAILKGRLLVLRTFLLAWTVTRHPLTFLGPCKAVALQRELGYRSYQILLNFEQSLAPLVQGMAHRN